MTAVNILIKIAFFSFFIALLYLILDYFVLILRDNLNISFLDLFSYLGIIQAIQILISFNIVSYLANQIISYFRSA